MINFQSTNELYIKKGGTFQQADVFVKSASIFTSLWEEATPPAPTLDPWFCMRIDTEAADNSQAGTTTFTILTQNTGSWNATVDWGDSNTSTITSYNDADLAHTYAAAGEYDISISGSFGALYFNNNSSYSKRILDIKSFGDPNMFTAWNNSFMNITSLQITATGSVVFSKNSSNWASNMGINRVSFGLAKAVNPVIENYDTSNVENFTSFFNGWQTLNRSIENLDFSSGTNFSLMFLYCGQFTGSLGHIPVHQCAGAGVNNGVYGIADFANINGSSTDTTNYDDTLNRWKAALDASGSVGAQLPYFDSKYSSAASAARTALVSTYGWSINDLGSI